MLSIREIHTLQEAADLKPAWEKLFRLQPHPWPFLAWSWFETFWKEMELPLDSPFLVTAWEGEELAGCAPMMVRPALAEQLAGRGYLGMENGYSEMYSWLLPPEPERAMKVCRFMLERVTAQAPRGHYFKFANLFQIQDPSRILVQTLKTLGYMVVLRYRRFPPLAMVPGKGLNPRSLMTKHKRSRLNNNFNRLKRMGQVRFQALTNPPDLDGILSKAWDLEADSWKGRQGTAVKQIPFLKRFYNLLAKKLATENRFILFVLWCDSEMVAFSYNLMDDRLVHGLKLGFNSRFSRVSPVDLLICDMIEWMQSEGYQGLNMGGEADPFKLHFGSPGPAADTIFAFPPGFRGTLSYGLKFGWKDFLNQFKIVRDWKQERDQRRPPSGRLEQPRSTAFKRKDGG